MGLGREVEGGFGAPELFFAVAVFVGADGDGVLREVGERLHDFAKTLVGCHGYGFEGFDFGFEGPGALGLRGGVGAGFAEAGDLFGEFVALGLEGFDLGDRVAALAVDGGEVGEDDGGVHATGAEFFFDKGQIGPDKC